mgnify:CR=1 FL=1
MTDYLFALFVAVTVGGGWYLAHWALIWLRLELARLARLLGGVA